MTDADVGKTLAVEGSAAVDPREPAAVLLTHVVACDPTEAPEVHEACRRLGGEVVRQPDAAAWLDQVGGAAAPPDVVVLTGRAENLLVGQWSRRVQETLGPTVTVLATSGTSVEHAASFVRAGVSALLLLPSQPEELARPLRECYAEAEASQPARRRVADLRSRLATVTRGEAEVLDALLAGAANKQIAQQLGIGLRTVELRRAKVMRKMDAKSVAQLVLHVAQAGVERVRPLLEQGRLRAPRS